MRSKSTVLFLTFPLLIAGCGGSKESVEVGKTASPAPKAPSRAPVSFNLDTGYGAGRASLEFTSSDSYYKYYEGTWKGQKIRFAEGPGIGSISIWNGNNAIASYHFRDYGVADFTTATKESSNGQYSYYDTNLKTQIKFKLTPAKVMP